MIGYELAQHHREPNIAWISFVLYPAGWLACMFSAASGRPWLGAIYAVLVMVVHVFGARPWESEFVLLLAASVLGACSESWLLQAGLVHYANVSTHSMLAPYWIVLVWGLFATILNTALRWLRGQWFAQVLGGLIGGPAAYYVGAQCGAIKLAGSLRAVLAIGLLWAVTIPTLMSLVTRLDGYDPGNRF